MRITKRTLTLILPMGFLLWGCSDDEPTASSEPTVETEFQIDADRVETFTPVGIEVGVTRGGSPMMMEHAQMQVEDLGDGSLHTFEMGPMGEGFGGEMMFFAPGAHELHFQGRRGMGEMVEDFGHHQLTVHRQHRLVGPYWVELSVAGAPVLQNESATVAFLVFELTNEGPGEAVPGLTVRVTVHDPEGQGPTLSLVESAAGRYEAEQLFGEAGLYELHLEIEVDETVETGDFHMPVLASSDDDGLGYRDHHGRGHGTDI